MNEKGFSSFDGAFPSSTRNGSTPNHQIRPARFLTGQIIRLGLVGGLVGTIIMDLFGAGIFQAIGGPASLSFNVIGDAAAVFFTRLGIPLAGGFPLGALLHYLIGLVFGILFAAAVAHVKALHLRSLKKGLGLGILYVELMSQPLLAMAAIVLRMTPAETVQWFGISFVMHLMYGAVLGAIVFLFQRN